MNALKTSDLVKGCSICGGSLMPMFFRFKIEVRQLAIDITAVNEVVGTARMFNNNLVMANVMSPNRDATIEMPGYQVDKDLYLCTNCAVEFQIGFAQIMDESER